MKKRICMFLSILLLCSMALSLAACGGKTQPVPVEPADPTQLEPETPADPAPVDPAEPAEPEYPAPVDPVDPVEPVEPEDADITDLMQGITANTTAVGGDAAMDAAILTDFAVRLFRAGQTEGENSLISPLSVLYALAMTANGARGETRAQMESVLGMNTEELNDCLFAYMRDLPCGKKYKLSLANSIWFTSDNRFTVNRDFLQTNADYYHADLYKAPFNDATCQALNDWVKDKTDGMISHVLDRIPSSAVMLLVNALAFDAEWAEPYLEYQVREGEFTREDGTKDKVEFLYDQEHAYLETDNAAGFIKYYAGGQYAFAALLPNEGVTVAELVDSLSGVELNRLLTHPQNVPVDTAIPKFESGYDAELSDVLSGMGMPLAFDGNRADFTALGTSEAGNIFISKVIHKTFISVTEQGTRAGAATVVIMDEGCALEPEQPKTVYLDSPFVYMLIDTRTGTPFFIGTMMDPCE